MEVQYIYELVLPAKSVISYLGVLQRDSDPPEGSAASLPDPYGPRLA